MSSLILTNEDDKVILTIPCATECTIEEYGVKTPCDVICQVDERDLTRAVLSQFPDLMAMLEFASGKVGTAANAVEKEIAEYETRIAKTFDGLRIVNDEYRALTDTRDRLTQASTKHARTLGEYRRLKDIMQPQDSMATPEAQ